MKTVILYATKYGAATEIARRIAERTDGAVLYDLKQGVPDLAGYDCIIVGSSVYAGMFRKEAKAFLSQNADILQQKKLGLFASGINPDENQRVFADNVPAEVLQSARTTAFLGGIFSPQKANLAERLIVKAAAKQAAYLNTIDDGKIGQFSEAMRSE